MKREILFKAKPIDKDCEWKWIEGSLIVEPNGTCTIAHPLKSNPSGFRYVEVLPETVFQFTGLTDKKDTKIFEGDILKMQNVGWKYTLVKFHSGGFCFYTTETSYLHPIVPCYSKEGEVVGNIHDNPDLLVF